MTEAFVPDRIVGIDPAKNHTGLALLGGQGQLLGFEQFNGKADPDVLSATTGVALNFAGYLLKKAPTGRTLYCMEKQLSVGGRMSALQFYVQMRLLEEIRKHDWQAVLVMPLPVQLKSYMRRRYGVVDLGSASERVGKVKEKTLVTNRRISQHQADAWFAAKLGLEVVRGTWKYKKSTREQRLISLEILYG